MTRADRTEEQAGALMLLFERGRRPEYGAIEAFAAAHRDVALAHMPGDEPGVARGSVEAGEGGADPDCLELVRDGLTFDLSGLSPGPACPPPQVTHHFDLRSLPGAGDHEALELTLGEHLAGGARSVPVAKGLFALGRDLIERFDSIEAAVWTPAHTAIGHRYFESVVSAWVGGGPFPALGLTAFDQDDAGGLASTGLAYWIGRELHLDARLCAERVAATRFAVRLIDQLVLVGGLDQAESITAPDGSTLTLTLSDDGGRIRVSPI